MIFQILNQNGSNIGKKIRHLKLQKSRVSPNIISSTCSPIPRGMACMLGILKAIRPHIVARYKRMKGFNVLHPMGWDAFGLPADQFAIKTGQHPKVTTQKNIARFKKQIQRVGLSYDWSREIDTTDPEYYRWTQWIFLKLFERGLAYQSFEPVNWCPELGTVLANEEVIDGKSEVGGFPVFKKPLRQWVLKITAYAERLLEDLELLDWPESLKEMQRHWIGKSQGARVTFKIKAHSGLIKTQAEPLSFNVFTTRPDTLLELLFAFLHPNTPSWLRSPRPSKKALLTPMFLKHPSDPTVREPPKTSSLMEKTMIKRESLPVPWQLTQPTVRRFPSG